MQPNALSNLAGRAERALGSVVESVTALLVLVEIVVLFSGVTTRYVFHKPLVWSDELASILFLWLSMLGAVVALRRGEHMRMTALVDNLQPAARALLDMLATVASLTFLALVMAPAWEYAHEEAFIVTPALEISNAWRAGAIPMGMGLMIVVALLRLLRGSSFLHIALGLAGAVALVTAFWLACSATCGAACRTCCWARCTWCRAFPARRRPTWPRWRRPCFPK